jgi:hypothetical protein
LTNRGLLMAEPISSEIFEVLAARAGLDAAKIGAERFEELRQGTRFLARVQRTVRRPRDRAAEPAHIFVHPKP